MMDGIIRAAFGNEGSNRAGLHAGSTACGVCHRPESAGGPENASLAGLPEDYIIRQIEDYRSGTCSTAVKAQAHVFGMITGLRVLSDAEIKQAAAYFAAMKLPPRIRMVEADSVPTSYVPA